METGYWLSRCKGRLSEEDRKAVIDMIAADPECGVLIEGGGGIRKVRFAIGARGKSGGVRVVYYFRNFDMPAFLLTVFAKNEQANLTPAQRAELGALAKLLAATYWRE
ncbi:MAG TPA: type II toxin-antitoxin system RelE/ParE family toxin [Azospirillaceae bacterium]|nr:type II toxin-antitoxin system RelE/ParE family toxin [Azospirillaceae bacterium]